MLGRERLFKSFFVLLLAVSSWSCIGLLGTFEPISSDPKLHWRTLETEHFRVHFYDGLATEAQKVAKICEEAHSALSKEIQWEPWGKVHVALVDLKDAPDAKATQFPFPELLIYLARPGVPDPLSQYDDWLRMIIFHEYTHILSLDAAGGFWHGLRYVFGRVVLPASIMPAWMSEGYAVFEESDKTSAGRNRSAFIDMTLRMDALENHLPPIDKLTLEEGRWPYGALPYYYGGRFYAWLAEKHPREKFGEYNTRYSSSLLNFALINRHARQIYGEGFPKLYREWQEELKTRYTKQKEQIEKKGLTPARRLTHDGESKIGLIYSPDGQNLLYSRKDGDSRTKFLQIPLDGKGSSKIIKYDFAAADLSWSPDQKSLLYSSTGRWNDYYEYTSMNQLSWKDQEIRAIRFKGGKDRPPSALPRDPNRDSRRFFNPSLSSQGNNLVFVGRELGTENLWTAVPNENGDFVWDKQKVDLRRITDARSGTEMNNPKWSADGKLIAVSLFDPDKKQRDLVLFSPEGKLLRQITDDKFQEQSPVWSPDGKKLYFSSNRSGVYNIFVFDLEKNSLLQVTNVLGGAFYPTLSPDGSRLAYLGYHARGFEVYEMHLDPYTFFHIADGKNRIADDELIDPSNNEPNLQEPLPSHIYQPWPEIFLPRFLAPEILIFNDDDFLFGAVTGATDALRRHTWSVGGYYRTKITEPGGSVSYFYTRWYPKFFLTGSADPIAQNGRLFVRSPISGNIFAVNGQFSDGILVQRDLIGKLGLSMKVPIRKAPGLDWVPGNHSISAGYEYIDRENVSDINPRIANFANPKNQVNGSGTVITLPPIPAAVFIPTEYRAAGFFVSYSYDSTLKRSRGISPTGEINQASDFLRGYSLALKYEYFQPNLGGNWKQQVFTADFRQYRRIPFTNHHVLALRAAGGFTIGQDANPETFNLGGSYSEGTANGTSRNFYPLRGFGGRVASGERMMLFSSEYRFPIWIVERGISDMPFYLKAIHGAFFADYGDARDRFFNKDSLHFLNGFLGAGAELRTDFTIFYNLPMSGRLGYGLPILANKNNVFSFSNGEYILNLGTTF